MNELLHSIEPWADAWSANLWRASWQGGLAIAAAWAIARWCKFLSPRVTCWMWRLVCLKLLVTLFWVQPVTIAILPAAEPPIRTAAIASDGPPSHFASASSTPENAVPAQRDAPTTRQIAGAKSSVPTGTILTLLWLTSVLCGVIITIRTWISTRRLCRVAVPVDGDLLQRACRFEAERLAIRRLPQIRLSSRVESPLLAGIWRPTIVLPDRAEKTFDEHELRLMLGHELAHQKRGDLIWNWLPTAVGWLFFFHPLVWLMKRCWLQAQEAACDELLIQNQVARPVEYGRLLLKLATRRLAESRAGLAAAGVLGSYRNLERRILAMTRVKPRSSRRLLAAATGLSLVVLLGLVPWTLVAQQPTPAKSAPVHDDQPKTQSDGHGIWLGDQTKSSPPTIIIAEHALFWDNQIVTWEQVLSGFRAIRLSGPFRARFAFTSAVARRKSEGWKYWNDRIMAVYSDLFSPIGITVGSLSPRGSEKFDAIRTTEDLRPDPARARTGDVLMPDGKPAAGAQVVVLPIADNLTVMLSGTQLRDPLDEQWTSTDATGRYTVYPQKDDCWIAALHPEGFALQKLAAKDEHRTVRLQPWATVTFSSTGESAGQTALINAYPTGTGPEGPYFDVYDLKTKGKPIDVKVPAGKMVVSRSLETKEGVSVASPVETLSLAPGEQRTLAVPPANAADRAAASDTFEQLHGAKKSDATPASTTKSAPADKPANDSAPPDTIDQKPSAAPKVQDSDELAERKRKAAPLLATMAKEHGYSLEANQSLRRIAPPFPAIRLEWYRVANPEQARAIPRGPNAMVFRWSKDRLANQEVIMTYSGPDPLVNGNSLTGLLDTLLGIKGINIDGPRELLDKQISGDWVVRKGATDEKVVSELTAILRKQLALRVRLEIRTVERPVYVAEGIYRHKPVPGGRDKDTISRDDKTITVDTIEIFGKELVHNIVGGSAGTFPTFLDWLGNWIGTPIVFDVKEPPKGELSWLMHGRWDDREIRAEDRDPKLVLANITAQTGLSFRKDTRPVRILFVSRMAP
jgi:beta-lactamase regulating signal transducer with metallopeptidase domain